MDYFVFSKKCFLCINNICVEQNMVSEQHTSYIIDLVFIMLFITSELIGISNAEANALVEFIFMSFKKLGRSISPNRSNPPSI